jgi:glycosyltransferase involved in cell wall biosynthesis
MINSPSYSKRLNENLFIGAAANKMLGVLGAIRDEGGRGFLVSIPVLGGSKYLGSYVGGVVLHDSRAPQIFLPIINNRYLRKLLSIFTFAIFCVVKVRKNDSVILYNHSLEFILGFFLLKIKGISPILDIEDAPRHDENSFYSHLMSSLFKLFFTLSNHKKLVVSNSLAESLKIKEYFVVYGAFRPNQNYHDTDSKEYRNLNVHYGGSISNDTGVDLFCNAIERLIISNKVNNIAVNFFITGFGSEEKFKKLILKCSGSKININLMQNLSQADFLKVLELCNASLVLKLPSSQIAKTTFPSKIVEIVSNRLLLITTVYGDIDYLFNESNAILLRTSKPEELEKNILHLINNPEIIKSISSKGYERSLELFSSKIVGRNLLNFINQNNLRL